MLCMYVFNVALRYVRMLRARVVYECCVCVECMYACCVRATCVQSCYVCMGGMYAWSACVYVK